MYVEESAQVSFSSGNVITIVFAALALAVNWGLLKGRIKGQEDTLVRHEETLEEHGETLEDHSIKIAEGRAWREGWDANERHHSNRNKQSGG